MNNSIYTFGLPQNEPIKEYLKGSREREELDQELAAQSKELLEIPLIIGGEEVKTGQFGYIRAPHNHSKVLAKFHKAGEKEVEMAIEAALKAHKSWADTPWSTRAAILLRAADLITDKYRGALNAATMLGQSKNIYQSEIDAVCESADFIRFNVHFASQIYSNQPISSHNQINSLEYRALEGFVFAVTPFNFTSIAANLNLAPVMMGNTTLWKPASTAVYSNYYLMKIFIEAGIPKGVINFLPGSGAVIGKKVLSSPHLAGIHFTGSNNTFNSLWRDVASNLESYRSYPRLVGETGGKDFIFVHPSANIDEVVNAAYCGAFEYQGQKCSAASRVYLPHSMWESFREGILQLHSKIKMGDVTEYNNFINAVIDQSSFEKIVGYIEAAKESNSSEIIFG
ncbi:MAG: aldehyde dehydrogenase family protein, partial [Bacteroidales bacterium]